MALIVCIALLKLGNRSLALLSEFIHELANDEETELANRGDGGRKTGESSRRKQRDPEVQRTIRLLFKLSAITLCEQNSIRLGRNL